MLTVAQIREAINKAGVSERKVARIEKQLAEAKAEHAANIAAIGIVEPTAPAQEETEEAV